MNDATLLLAKLLAVLLALPPIVLLFVCVRVRLTCWTRRNQRCVAFLCESHAQENSRPTPRRCHPSRPV